MTTPPPHLNLTMSSLGAVSHHQHTKIKKTKSNTRHTKLTEIYTSKHTLPKTQSHPNKSKLTHIYKLTPPKTCKNQPSNTTNHNTIKIHKNTKMMIIASNGSATSKFHHKMITNKNTILIFTTIQKEKERKERMRERE